MSTDGLNNLPIEDSCMIGVILHKTNNLSIVLKLPSDRKSYRPTLSGAVSVFHDTQTGILNGRIYNARIFLRRDY